MYKHISVSKRDRYSRLVQLDLNHVALLYTYYVL